MLANANVSKCYLMLANFHEKYVITLYQQTMKLMNMINVIYGFTLNAVKLTLKLTTTSKKRVIPDIAFNAQLKYFLFQM